MGLDEGFDPFPDGGTFRTDEAFDAKPWVAERAAARGAARQLSMELPSDIADVLELALRLVGVGPDGGAAMQAPALLARVRGLTQLATVIDAARAQAVRAAECAQAAEFDGHKSMTSWQVGHLNVSSATATRAVRAGRTFEHLPAWAAAAAEGRVTPDQTAIVAKVATPARLSSAAEMGALRR